MFLSAAMADAEIGFALDAAEESFKALRASVGTLQPHAMFAKK